MKRAIREQIEFLERNGIRVDSHRITGNNHVLLRVRHGRRKGLVTIASSPSDVRSRLNMLTSARRACGVV